MNRTQLLQRELTRQGEAQYIKPLLSHHRVCSDWTNKVGGSAFANMIVSA